MRGDNEEGRTAVAVRPSSCLFGLLVLSERAEVETDHLGVVQQLTAGAV